RNEHEVGPRPYDQPLAAVENETRRRPAPTGSVDDAVRVERGGARYVVDDERGARRDVDEAVVEDGARPARRAQVVDAAAERPLCVLVGAELRRVSVDLDPNRHVEAVHEEDGLRRGVRPGPGEPRRRERERRGEDERVLRLDRAARPRAQFSASFSTAFRSPAARTTAPRAARAPPGA